MIVLNHQTGRVEQRGEDGISYEIPQGVISTVGREIAETEEYLAELRIIHKWLRWGGPAAMVELVASANKIDKLTRSILFATETNQPGLVSRLTDDFKSHLQTLNQEIAADMVALGLVDLRAVLQQVDAASSITKNRLDELQEMLDKCQQLMAE